MECGFEAAPHRPFSELAALYEPALNMAVTHLPRAAFDDSLRIVKSECPSLGSLLFAGGLECLEGLVHPRVALAVRAEHVVTSTVRSPTMMVPSTSIGRNRCGGENEKRSNQRGQNLHLLSAS